MSDQKCRHRWRHEAETPGLYTVRVCTKCGQRERWGCASDLDTLEALAAAADT